MTELVTTPYFLLSFPNVFVPKPRAQGGEPVFSISMVFDEKARETDEYAFMIEQIKAAAREKWGDKLPVGMRNPVRDGAEKDYDGYGEGKVFVSAWTKNKPGIVDAQLNDVLTSDEVWAGQIARATIKPFAYDNSGNKGVSIALENLQIVKKDMPRLDGRQAANKAFGRTDKGTSGPDAGKSKADVFG